MKVQLTDESALRRVSWSDLKSYLEAEGWTRTGLIGDKAMIFERADDHKALEEILVPSRDDVGDYVSRIADAISTLAKAEMRSPLEVYQDIFSAGSDVIRFRAPVGEPSGSIGIEDGVALYREAENLILAAACAAKDARRSYHLRKVTEATDYLRGVKLAPSERGSYVLTVLSPVQPRLGRQQHIDFGEEPFARNVTLCLSEALGAVGTAANMALAQNDFTPFEEAVAHGVSANLCESVAMLAETGNGIDISLYWARTRPSAQQNRVFKFKKEFGEVLREAARIYRESEPLTDMRIEGFVIKLDRPIEQFDGCATLRIYLEGKTRSVKVSFSEPVYQMVIRAFQDKSAISLLGDLVQQNQRWEIRNPRDLKIVDDFDS